MEFLYRGFASGANPEIVEFRNYYLPNAKENAIDWFLDNLSKRQSLGANFENTLDSSICDQFGVTTPWIYGIVVSLIIVTDELELAFAIMGEENSEAYTAAIEQEEHILNYYENISFL